MSLSRYLRWIWNSVKSTRCRHQTTRGVANFYDRDTKTILQLLVCEDCTMVIIEPIGG